MTYRSSTRLLKAQLEDAITKGVKDRIRQLDLIDTGKMLNSFDAQVNFEDDGLDMKFSTTDYFKYQDGYNNITDYVLDSPKIVNMMNELFGAMMEDIMMQDDY